MQFSTWADAEESFDEFLDLHSVTVNDDGLVEIAGLTFSPSAIIKELQPVSYRCLLNDHLDAVGIDSDDLEGERF